MLHVIEACHDALDIPLGEMDDAPGDRPTHASIARRHLFDWILNQLMDLTAEE